MRRPAPEPTPQETDIAADDGESVAPRSEAAPLPPVRPYDLGPREASAVPKPPSRAAANRALYFAPPRPPHPDPLARLLKPRPARFLSDDNDE